MRTPLLFIGALMFLGLAYAEVSPQYYENQRGSCRQDACCLSSVDAMKKAGGVLPGPNGSCFPQWRQNTMKCATSRTWCEPDLEVANKVSTEPMTAAQYENAKKTCGQSSCCLGSVETIFRGKHSVASEGGLCPAGYDPEMLRCHDSLRWCVKKTSASKGL